MSEFSSKNVRYPGYQDTAFLQLCQSLSESTFKSVDLRNDLEASRISKHSKHRLAFVNDFVRTRVAELQWHSGDEEHLQKRLQKALASEGVPPMTQDKLLQTARHIISKCKSAREKALGAGKHKGVGKSSRKS